MASSLTVSLIISAAAHEQMAMIHQQQMRAIDIQRRHQHQHQQQIQQQVNRPTISFFGSIKFGEKEINDQNNSM